MCVTSNEMKLIGACFEDYPVFRSGTSCFRSKWSSSFVPIFYFNLLLETWLIVDSEQEGNIDWQSKEKYGGRVLPWLGTEEWLLNLSSLTVGKIFRKHPPA